MIDEIGGTDWNNFDILHYNIERRIVGISITSDTYQNEANSNSSVSLSTLVVWRSVHALSPVGERKIVFTQQIINGFC